MWRGTTFTEFGTFNPRRVGQGSNLSETVAVLKARGLKGVALEMPGTFLRYHNGLEKMLVHLQEEFDDSAFKPLPGSRRPSKSSRTTESSMTTVPSTGSTTLLELLASQG